MADREPFVVPEGWELVTDVKRNGATVKYYTNIIGQRFYSEEDLMRNIKDAKAKGFGIYDPEFDPSTVKTRGKKIKKETATPSSFKKEKHGSNVGGKRVMNSKNNASSSKKQKEVVNQPKIQRTSNTSDFSSTRSGLDSGANMENNGSRTSRRLAGAAPELQPDFIFDKTLEYFIKEKPSK